MPKAKAAALRALELDDSLAEAHASLARIRQVYEWDWAGAEKEYQRAIDLNPRYLLARDWHGAYLAAIGNQEASLAERKRALELDPLSPTLNFALAQSFYWSRDYERAIQQFQKLIELDPNFPPIYIYLPSALEQTGRRDEAVETIKKMPLKEGTEWAFAMGALGRIYAETGRKQEARAILEQIERVADTRYIPAQGIALVYIGLGEKDKAFSLLDKAVEQRAFQLQWIKVDPRWDAIRSDPRYADIVRRMGLPTDNQ
jgi:serine/threonine-protein kinase